VTKWKWFVVNGRESKNLIYTATEFFVSFQDDVSESSAIMWKNNYTSVEYMGCF